MKKTILLSAIALIYVNALAQESPLKVKEIGFVFSNLNSFGLRYKVGNEKCLFRITALSLNGSNTDNSYDNYSYNGASASVPSTQSNSFGGGLNIGFECRKPVNNKSYIYWGLDWINSYSQTTSNTATPIINTLSYDSGNAVVYKTFIYNNSTSTTTKIISTGLGVVVGYTYRISEAFTVSAELIPSVSYRHTQAETTGSSARVDYAGNNNGYPIYVETPTSTNQTTINKGITYSLTNAAASITIAYRIN